MLKTQIILLGRATRGIGRKLTILFWQQFTLTSGNSPAQCRCDNDLTTTPSVTMSRHFQPEGRGDQEK